MYVILFLNKNLIYTFMNIVKSWLDFTEVKKGVLTNMTG